MSRIISINFYQNRPEIKLFLPKNIKFSSAGGPPLHPMPPVVKGSDPRLPQRPHCRFLASGLHEEKFTVRYCRPPFILAFGFKYV